tara:strand:- start:267 stop:383 length:117 start_codon:yes stop_codon:yes gene_type:complete
LETAFQDQATVPVFFTLDRNDNPLEITDIDQSVATQLL